MLSKKEANKLGRPDTIDLKYIIAREYCDKVELSTKKDIIVDKIYTTFFYIGIVWTSLYIIGLFITPTFADDIQSEIRMERLYECQEAYDNSEINKQYIYGQIPAVRCATYMTLVYAYESKYGQSNMCITTKNCHGMKGNGYDTPQGFLEFDTYNDGRKYFAKKYWRWHYKKTTDIFVNDWSMTDRETYKAFMENKYSEVYRELEHLYMTSR